MLSEDDSNILNFIDKQSKKVLSRIELSEIKALNDLPSYNMRSDFQKQVNNGQVLCIISKIDQSFVIAFS